MADSKGATGSGGADADPTREETGEDTVGAISTRKGDRLERSSRTSGRLSKDKKDKSEDDADARDEKPAGRGKRADRKGKNKKDAKTAKKSSRNPFRALVRYIKEIVAELRKVIRPTRKEFISYSIVVVVFLVVLTAFVALIDIGFQWSALRIFGSGPTG